jgi:hypothetical protein
MSNLFEKVEDEDWMKSQGEEKMGKNEKDVTKNIIFIPS